MTIAGSGFVAGSTCDFGPSIQVTACTFVDANTMSAAVTIPEGAALGPIQVQVTDPHQQQHPASADFTVLGLPLEVDGINPSQGAPGQPMSLTITGANFQPGATCSFGSGSGIQVDSCTPVAGHESRLLAIDIRIADDAKSGLRGDQVLTVTNPDNQSATGRFHVRIAGSPIVDQVTPASGVPGDHLTLTISGYGFGDPIRCEFSAIDLQTGERIPSGITVDACTVNNPNQLTVAISIAPDASLGLRELLLVKPAPTPRLGACGFVVERAP